MSPRAADSAVLENVSHLGGRGVAHQGVTVRKWGLTRGDLCGCEWQFHSYRAPGMAHSPRFYEILINHTPPGGFVTKGIMRGCHVASWHECRCSSVRVDNFMPQQNGKP